MSFLSVGVGGSLDYPMSYQRCINIDTSKLPYLAFSQKRAVLALISNILIMIDSFRHETRRVKDVKEVVIIKHKQFWLAQ